jgi:hypothetical protein
MYETLQYPLLLESGYGGFSCGAGRKRRSSNVQSTARKQLTLFDYVQAMIYQSPRYALLGRLSQAWTLDQFSRWQHMIFDFMRSSSAQQCFRSVQCCDLDSPDAGRGFLLPASVPGTWK